MVRLILGALLLSPLMASAQDETIIEKLEAIVEPAEAPVGSTVTVKINLQLKSGWYTYPVVQTDRGAKDFVNKITFTPGSLIYVEKPKDPENPKSKSEAEIGIEKLLYYPGGGTWTVKAVVSPNAKPGDALLPIKLNLQICDANTCLPPKKAEVKPIVKIVPGTAGVEAVEPKYRETVEKVLKDLKK
jgi:hypothetical protein